MPFQKWQLVGVYESDTCPRRVITRESLEWLSLYGHYKAGHLAVDGGTLDQPAIYLDAMRTIDTVKPNV